ncbi:uncharacterized protein HMPREF1541_09276 [Cyphellophora europaea CBS 101466]|uniref:2,6-dihydroxypyridine 3-monooxygenase substrate binding domain-containing protein n=1 Tax=Cyphellophora europaea (strain CBS 101466) TaxID=1220924 RepID=W2S9Z5_CYPE1|nr:uncharacterized protein HMPREF1541_09276 [Cyphellophora europaea CBS 101466]ETN45445.1 hypothetical protein HMPREF1541_09276 [Cyphellophora europaea CBS 101466]
MASYPDSLDVVIVGGSLAGLFAGVVLKTVPSVASITILERYEIDQLQDLGAGIRTGSEANDAILKFTGQPPEKYAAFVDAYRFISTNGGVSADQPTISWTSTWGQLYRVLRQSFDADSRCKYRHGCTLSGLTEQVSSSTVVEFQNEQGKPEILNANVVIGADGASSKVRSLMLPESKRSSVGYVVYRGLVPMEELSENLAKTYEKAGTFHWSPKSQLVSYVVPSNETEADQAKRMVNWVWYQHRTDEAIERLLTDKSGKRHRFSLPAGGMDPNEIASIKEKATKELPAMHTELIGRTEEPFVQVVTDSLAGSNLFFDGKLLLVGDAVGGQRPHTASALTQCAFHAVVTKNLLEGRIDQDQWAQETRGLSSLLVDNGKELGEVCMNDEPESIKTPEYFQMFLKNLKQVNTMWRSGAGMETEVPPM